MLEVEEGDGFLDEADASWSKELSFLSLEELTCRTELVEPDREVCEAEGKG